MNINTKLSDFLVQYGVKLYDTELVIENKKNIFRIFIINKDETDLNLYAKISKDLDNFLDKNLKIEDSYVLEVSSPGIDRKLNSEEHFKNSINETIEFIDKNGKKHIGILKSIEKQIISVDIKSILRKFNILEINKTKIFFKF